MSSNALRRTGHVALLAAGLLGVASSARAGDITVFVSANSPSDVWGYGQGAALSLSLLKVVVFEGEAARNSSDTLDTRTTYFTGSALLALPIRRLTPYGGVGVGLFQQNRGSTSDFGSLKAVIFGAKLRIEDLLVLKAEYRRLDLLGTPLVDLDSRISAGAGVSF